MWQDMMTRGNSYLEGWLVKLVTENGGLRDSHGKPFSGGGTLHARADMRDRERDRTFVSATVTGGGSEEASSVSAAAATTASVSASEMVSPHKSMPKQPQSAASHHTMHHRRGSASASVGMGPSSGAGAGGVFSSNVAYVNYDAVLPLYHLVRGYLTQEMNFKDFFEKMRDAADETVCTHQFALVLAWFVFDVRISFFPCAERGC
jgi:hypothetical protein